MAEDVDIMQKRFTQQASSDMSPTDLSAQHIQPEEQHPQRQLTQVNMPLVSPCMENAVSAIHGEYQSAEVSGSNECASAIGRADAMLEKRNGMEAAAVHLSVDDEDPLEDEKTEDEDEFVEAVEIPEEPAQETFFMATEDKSDVDKTESNNRAPKKRRVELQGEEEEARNQQETTKHAVDSELCSAQQVIVLGLFPCSVPYDNHENYVDSKLWDEFEEVGQRTTACRPKTSIG